jgi:hypothetical protein
MTGHLRAFLGAGDEALLARITEGGPLAAVRKAIASPLSEPARTVLAAELTAAVGGLLEEELDTMLLSGLLTYQGLADAARQTAADPDLTHLVTLDDHLVRVVHEPHLDVCVDRNRVCRLRFTLSVTFSVQGLAATVRAGRLVHVRIARCTALAELTWDAESLLHHDDLVGEPLVLRLGSGVPIPRAATEPAQVRGTARVTPLPS